MENMKKALLDISMPDYLKESDNPKDQEASPFEVLNRAAAQMEQRTGGMVQAKIYLAPFLGTIRYTFYLVVPDLNGYTDPLFYVWTSQPDRGYPVCLRESATEQDDQTPYDTAEGLVKRLEQIFASSWAKSRIRQWINMAEEREGVR